MHYYEDRTIDSFPESHTCFFTIDIGPYKTIESMTGRFRQAIELCGEIDADHDADGIADEDGNYGEGRESNGYYNEEEEE